MILRYVLWTISAHKLTSIRSIHRFITVGCFICDKKERKMSKMSIESHSKCAILTFWGMKYVENIVFKEQCVQKRDHFHTIFPSKCPNFLMAWPIWCTDKAKVSPALQNGAKTDFWVKFLDPYIKRTRGQFLF